MSNARSGDLAVIVQNRFSQNIGIFVRLKKIKKLVQSNNRFISQWTFEKASSPIMFATEQRNKFYVATDSEDSYLISDEDVHPIRAMENMLNK